VDRTPGANPIRQHLGNLNEAGQMYGAIIYYKAPIMMRQLEALIGEDKFREGMREYLQTYSFDNATWLDLVTILDKKIRARPAGLEQCLGQYVRAPGDCGIN
jgi:aminopeptidase N